MKHGSLFSGIGGFDLAAQWMGWENVFQVEIDSFCQKVLEKNFPQVKRYGDIKEFDGTKYRGSVDVLSGGFPCQPYSNAGKRKGKEDPRHLWPQMLRVVREIQPIDILGENVSGLVNWSGGMVFEEVQADLEAEGYEVQSFILPACALNAPHRRDRVWILAHSKSNRDKRNSGTMGKAPRRSEEQNDGMQPYREGKNGNATNTSSDLIQGREIGYQPSTWPKPINEQFSGRNFIPRQDWKNFPTQPAICRRDDGISDRVDRIKSLGNAIVPQVAFEIFKAIEKCC